MQESEMGTLELDPLEDSSKIFSGLTYLLGVDFQESPGVYFFSIQDVMEEFNKI